MSRLLAGSVGAVVAFAAGVCLGRSGWEILKGGKHVFVNVVEVSYKRPWLDGVHHGYFWWAGGRRGKDDDFEPLAKQDNQVQPYPTAAAAIDAGIRAMRYGRGAAFVRHDVH